MAGQTPPLYPPAEVEPEARATWVKKTETNMSGVREKPRKCGKYQGWFVNARGERKFFFGTCSRAETRRMAKRLEDEHRQIRLGYRPAPSTADRHRSMSFNEVSIEYQE